MILDSILTDRHFNTWPSWHIVYEWENEISEILNLPIKNSPTYESHPIYRKFKGIDSKLFNAKLHPIIQSLISYNSGYSLYFEMNIKNSKNFSNSSKTIPIIIDFFERSRIENFKRNYAECSNVLVSSIEVFQYLKENNFNGNLKHFPMTIPSIYRLDPDKTPKKSFDIVLAGRVNTVLWNYLKRYERKHPEVEYLYQYQDKNTLYYKSNKKGIVGKCHSRSDYIKLIRQAKVSFYATPGIDGGEQRTNGFNPVTPRFFELLAAGCNLIMRYPTNIETEFYNLEYISPSVTSYQEFKKQLDVALKTRPPLYKYAKYLEAHYTSTQINIIKNLD